MGSFHLGKLGLFILLNVADFGLTWRLLNGSMPEVVESNPVANACLEQHGWAGLALLKLGVVFVVLAVCLVVSRYRPRTSGRLLVFACTVLAFVVLYSCGVLWFTEVYLIRCGGNWPLLKFCDWL
jgi:hypothetical protein